MLLEIFRAGKHRDSNGTDREFTESDLAQIAQTYDPVIYRAPILKNHDETQPNVGLISGVAKLGDRLFALPYKVDEAFAQQVNQGRYPAVSVALYHPNDPSNPKPGNWGLRHLGFPQIPAVKGMKAPSFAENPDHDVTINFEEVMPYEPTPVEITEQKTEIKEDTSDMTETLEQREARLNEREKLLQEKEAQIESDRAALQEAQFNEFIKANSTKIHPKEKAYILAAMKNMANMTATVTFGEASLTPLQAFQKSITERPNLVEFGELAPSTGSGSTKVEFSAPKGYRVESNALDRHSRAFAYCEAHKLDPHNQSDYLKALGAIS
jgi:hypothetical protein